MEAPGRVGLPLAVLQTAALPLGYGAMMRKAEDLNPRPCGPEPASNRRRRQRRFTFQKRRADDSNATPEGASCFRSRLRPWRIHSPWSRKAAGSNRWPLPATPVFKAGCPPRAAPSVLLAGDRGAAPRWVDLESAVIAGSSPRVELMGSAPTASAMPSQRSPN